MRIRALIVLALFPASLRAQNPLVTDDASVTSRGGFHLDLFLQAAKVAANATPVTHQQTLTPTLSYGLASRLDVSFDYPLLRLQDSMSRVGAGDLSLTAKYMLRIPADSTALRVALAGGVELPTGDVSEGFGSGVADVGMNLIGEWQPWGQGVLRHNLGMQFTGNTLTGAIGIPDKGFILSAATSLSQAIGSRWIVAGEITGYQGWYETSDDSELRAQFAAVFALSSRAAVAGSVQRGWLASPPWQLQVGLAWDL